MKFVGIISQVVDILFRNIKISVHFYDYDFGLDNRSEKVELNSTEQQTLLGLVEHPCLTDTQLAAELGLNRSTFATTKASLLKRHFFRTLFIPDFHRLGFELLMISTGSLSASIDYAVRRRSWEHIHGNHNHFFTISDPETLLTMVFGHDLTELQERIDLFEYHYTRGKFLDSGTLEYHFFPLALSAVHTDLDWANLLRSRLGLPAAPRELSEPGKVQGSPLNDRSWAVLKALVAAPEAPLSQISLSSGVSRLTATRIKEHLLEEGLLRPQRILNARSLGYTIWAYLRLPFGSGSTIEERREVTAQALGQNPLTFFEKKQEAVGVFLFPDLEVYHATVNTLTRQYESAGHLASKPQVRFFLLSNVKFSDPYNYTQNLNIGTEPLPTGKPPQAMLEAMKKGRGPPERMLGGHPGGN